MRKLDTRLLRHLNKAKGQFIAIAMVIVLGLMIYVGMNSAYINLDLSLQAHYEDHLFPDLFSEVMKINEPDIEDLKKIPGVTQVEGRRVVDVPLKVEGDQKVNVRLVSSKYQEDSLNQVYALEGQNMVTNKQTCLVIEKFALARGIKVGDIITPHIAGRDFDLEVVGIVSSPEYVYLMENEQSFLPAPDKFGVLYVTDRLMQEATGQSSYNEVIIKLEEDAKIDIIKKVFEKELDDFGLSRIYDREEQLSNRLVHEEMNGLKQTSQSVPIVFLGVAAFILAVMINRMVKGDRLAIGILKSMGYSNGDVIVHYTKLSVIIGLVGGGLGVVLGYLLSIQFTGMYNTFFSIPSLKFLFRLDLVFLSAGLVAVFSVVAGLLGARKSLKISPAESMRPEPPKTGKKVFVEGTWLWKKLSFTNKMVMRNILRSKKRTFFIAIGISLTFAITLVPFFMMSTFNNMFNTMYDEFMVMDYNVNFSKGVHDKVLYDMRNTLDLSHIEGKIEFPFEIHKTWRSKAVNVIGIEANSQFFNFKNINKEPVALQEGDFFLSEGLAKILDIQAGDVVRIESYIPDRDDVEVKVTQIVKQSLGANAYMYQRDMQALLMDDNYINGVYINSDKDMKEAVENFRLVSSILTSEDMKGSFEEFLSLIISALGMLLMFGGILGFAIIYNSAVISINERRLEFSSLRVMGFRKNEIFVSLLRENLITALVGIVLGIPIARSMLESLSDTFSTELYSFDIEITSLHLFLTAIATLVFVIIGLLAAYKKIHGLDFIEALKNRVT